MNPGTEAFRIAFGLAALAAGWYVFNRSQSGSRDAPLLGMFLAGGALASVLSKQKGVM